MVHGAGSGRTIVPPPGDVPGVPPGVVPPTGGDTCGELGVVGTVPPGMNPTTGGSGGPAGAGISPGALPVKTNGEAGAKSAAPVISYWGAAAS